MYGCEAWTKSRALGRRLEAAEMWLMRKILKIKWTDKITNEEVVRRVGEKRSLLATIIARQMEIFGHVIR